MFDCFFSVLFLLIILVTLTNGMKIYPVHFDPQNYIFFGLVAMGQNGRHGQLAKCLLLQPEIGFFMDDNDKI